MSGDEIYTKAIGPERNGRVQGCGLGVTPTQLTANKPNLTSSQTPVDHKQFMKLKSTMKKMQKALALMGYTIEESDDDLDESLPKENVQYSFSSITIFK